MDKMRRFARDARGTTFEGLALAIAVIALVSIAATDVLDRMGRAGQLPEFAFLKNAGFATAARPTGKGGAVSGDQGIDYSATASTSRRYTEQRSVLDAPSRK